MNFEKKTILITGASTGIGKELAVAFSKTNCKIILVARRVELLERLVDELFPNSKAEFLTLKCNVSKKEEVAEAYQKSISKFGRIDVAILNAGFGENMQVEEYNSKLAETTFGANVFGIIYWVEQLLPEFLKRKSGFIVGISSLADNRGFSESGFYCASKAAASIYLEGLSVELKKHNIKVTTVKPGFVKTPMTDKNDFEMPLLMKADKAAKIIVSGIKKEKRIIQFPLPIVLLHYFYSRGFKSESQFKNIFGILSYLKHKFLALILNLKKHFNEIPLYCIFYYYQPTFLFSNYH